MKLINIPVGVIVTPRLSATFVTFSHLSTGRFSMISAHVHQLNANEIQRYNDLRIIRCLDCCTPLPINFTSNNYVICENCNAKHDLLLNRPATINPSRHITVKTLDVNGRLHSRKVSVAAFSQLPLPL